MEECVHGMPADWCSTCSDPSLRAITTPETRPSNRETKQDVVARICVALGIPTLPIGVGSSIPSELFDDMQSRFHVEPRSSMPEKAEALARKAGIRWESEHDSRGTFSGGGSTVTLSGLLAVEKAVAVLLSREADTPQRVRRMDISTGVTVDMVDQAQRQWRELGPEAFHAKFGTAPAAKYIIVDPAGMEYDAKAILMGARTLGGLPGTNGDFKGERRTVAEPLAELGYVVEDRFDVERLVEPVSERDEDVRARATEAAKEFVGQTDIEVFTRVRREQAFLRRALGLGGASHECALCGRTFPDELLVAAHIKKRSLCSHEERTDIPSVAMIACTLGCDALFEKGYLTVDESGAVRGASHSSLEQHLVEFLSSVEGRTVRGWQASSGYFAWHRSIWTTHPTESSAR
jgi:hypothetical protein